VDSNTGNCPPAFGQLVFSIGNKIVLTAGSLTTEVCDNDLNGSEQVNLAGFITLFTANPGITASYHNSLTDAQNDVNAVSATQLITGTHTFFIRFESNSGCPNTAQLTVNLKAPKKSDVLKDVTICPGSTTVLDAGSGFTSYLWSNGATTPTVSVGVGSYYVDLGFNGCKYRQFVNVIPAQQPVITSIDVKGDVVTINVTGGTPPYQYSLDGLTWQNSNVFMGVSKGVHTAYVRSVEKCRPVTKDFLVLDLINAITPNGDGVNDVLDYTDLSSKENVSIQVFDRYGATIHQSKGKNYIWDGKVNGRVISSGTYWYLLKWTDPQTKEPVEYSGWILLKNRE
jgi:gliding motility-associated-like protein